MNANLLAPSSNVFYLRGTTGDRGNMCLPLLWASHSSRSVSLSAMSAQGTRSFTAIALWSGSPAPLSAQTLPLPTMVRRHCLPPTALSPDAAIFLHTHTHLRKYISIKPPFCHYRVLLSAATVPLPPRPCLKKWGSRLVIDTSASARSAMRARGSLRHPQWWSVVGER